MNVTGRDHLLTTKALAIAIEIVSRAHPRHRPESDADDMLALYLHLVPEEAERLANMHSVHWLLGGGLDLREREPDPMPLGPAPTAGEPGPRGGEAVAA